MSSSRVNRSHSARYVDRSHPSYANGFGYGDRPSTSSELQAMASGQIAYGKIDNSRPRSSRERRHATGSSNRPEVYGVGGNMYQNRPASAWIDKSSSNMSDRRKLTNHKAAQHVRAQSARTTNEKKKGTLPSTSSQHNFIIGERKSTIAAAMRQQSSDSQLNSIPKRLQKKKIEGCETNVNQINIHRSEHAGHSLKIKEMQVTPAPSPVPAPSEPKSRPYKRKEDVNLIRRLADKLATLGPAQATIRNNLQNLEARTENADKLLTKSQLCDGFARFGFKKDDIERVYTMFHEIKKPDGVKVIEFLNFFEHFTPLDDEPASNTKLMSSSIVQSSAPWNRSQSLRSVANEVPDHDFDDVTAVEMHTDTRRAFDVHLMNIVRDLLYHKDNLFRTAFRKMDLNRDGQVSKVEFVSKLKEMGLSNKQSSRLADMIDYNQSNYIDYNEFLSAFDNYNPIEKAAAFKENHIISPNNSSHPEMVINVQRQFSNDDSKNTSDAHRLKDQTTTGYCFEMLSCKMRERENIILQSLKGRDFDNNGIIPAASAVEAIIGTVKVRT